MTLLYLDIDGPLPAGWMDRIVWACRVWGWPIEAIRIDRTRHGYHVVVGVRRRLAAARIVAAQAILGSDPKREAYNLMRVARLGQVPRFWRTRWNVLYVKHYRPVRHAVRHSP